jgi:hypothetical protein
VGAVLLVPDEPREEEAMKVHPKLIKPPKAPPKRTGRR